MPAPTAADDDGTALLDELAPWDADESAELAEPVKGRDGKGERGARVRASGAGRAAASWPARTSPSPSTSAGKPQKFSQPTIGDKGTLAACSGGGTPVDVTRGRLQGPGGRATRPSDDKDDRGDRSGRRGWWRR